MSFRTIDTDTGEVVQFPGAQEIERLRRENAELQELVESKDVAISVLTRTNSHVNSQLSRMRGEQLDSAKQDPFWQDALEVYGYWKQQICPGSTEMGDKRWLVLRARLNAGFTVEQLCRAIDGAALMPATAKGRDSMVKLEYICRHPDHVEGFIGDVDRVNSRSALTQISSHTRRKQDDNTAVFEIGIPWPFDRACHALRREFGTGTVEVQFNMDKEFSMPTLAFGPCPLEPLDRPWPLVIQATGDFFKGELMLACSHGHGHEALFTAVRELEFKFDSHWQAARERAAVGEIRRESAA